MAKTATCKSVMLYHLRTVMEGRWAGMEVAMEVASAHASELSDTWGCAVFGVLSVQCSVNSVKYSVFTVYCLLSSV